MNSEQMTLWNGRAGRAWVDEQEVLDRAFQPFEDLLVEAVSSARANRVLDVGCGTGSTTLAIARRLGAAGSCVGIDISDPMLTLARARAERENSRATFIRANAQDHAFESATFDMIVSRFGVMFFDNPIQAFTNLRRAATDDATLRLIVFRGIEENPFMTAAERAASPFLPTLPARRPDGPGQFAFADPLKVQSIFDASGWPSIHLEPINVTCTFPASELTGYFTRLGPLGAVLQDADAQTRARIIAAGLEAFSPYVHGTEVRFIAACWMVRSR